jgi:hypothetical protein
MSLLKPFRSVIPVANNDTATYYVSMQPVTCGPTSAKFVSANLTFQPSTQTLAVNKSPLIYSNTRSIFNLTTSPTPPLNPKVGDLWYDTSTDIEFEYIFDGVNFYWVDISSPLIPGTVQFVYRTASGAANANILYALADSVNNYSNVIEFSVNTTNFTDGTTIYWRDIGTANNSQANLLTPIIRFAGAANSGNLVIINNSNTLSRIAIDDGGTFLPNVTTNLQIGFYSCASFINFIGASNAVPIIDNSIPNYPFPMTYLIVGGGGGGGGTGSNGGTAAGGGGGGGGFRTATGPGQVGSGIPFQIIVGNGGTAGCSTGTGTAGNGQNTSIITPIAAGMGSSCQLIAYGGGGAGNPTGLTGGSGGGGGGGQRASGVTGSATGGSAGPSCPTSYFPNQFGNPGGSGGPSTVPNASTVRASGGGGGGGGANTAGSCGAAGSVQPTSPSGITGGLGGAGGAGRLFPHTGLSYAGGGGGAGGRSNRPGFPGAGGSGGNGGGGQGAHGGGCLLATAGTPGTGGGGGGDGTFGGSTSVGKAGGPGTVIIIVPTSSAPRIGNRTGTVSISTPAFSPGNTVFTWTSNGSFST